jgi:hypothetical protein
MQTRGGARNQLPEAIARAVTIEGGGKRDNFGVDEINSALLCPDHIKVTFCLLGPILSF